MGFSQNSYGDRRAGFMGPILELKNLIRLRVTGTRLVGCTQCVLGCPYKIQLHAPPGSWRSLGRAGRQGGADSAAAENAPPATTMVRALGRLASQLLLVGLSAPAGWPLAEAAGRWRRQLLRSHRRGMRGVCGGRRAGWRKDGARGEDSEA